MSRLPTVASSGRFFIAVLVPLVWAGCSPDTGESPTAPPAELARGGVAGPPQELGPALEAQERHGARLMAIEGVVGHGVGIGPDGEPAITVFTLQPGVRGVPEELDGVKVRKEVTGLFFAGSDPTTKARPAPVGFSVGHPDITAGTIGARVLDGSGNVYVLSNNHVLANSNNASIGDPALQPGPFDGGTSADSMAWLAAFEEIQWDTDEQLASNTMDAAIAGSVTDNLGNATPSDDGYGTPSSTTLGASVDLPVQKYGRTTGLTTGQVAEINVTATVCYEGFAIFCTKAATFVDQISITPGEFSDGGDSGSLIVTNDANKNPVGLLFAGSSSRTLANPIDPVLQEFGITVDGSDSGTDENSSPTASFTHSCTDLTCSFDGSGSSDSDGSISSYEWDFGDGDSGSGVTVSHTYADYGTYTVTLTVTDDDGATGSDSQPVDVSETATDGITLSVTGYKDRGLQKADLEWTTTSASQVDVYRDGNVIATTANDGFYTDHIDQRGSGSYTYQVCEEGSDVCSNEATVSF